MDIMTIWERTFISFSMMAWMRRYCIMEILSTRMAEITTMPKRDNQLFFAVSNCLFFYRR